MITGNLEELTRLLSDKLPMACIVYSSDEEKQNIDAFISTYLKAGCGLFMFYGPLAEEFHDLCDNLIIKQGNISTATTWHEDEELEEVIWQAENVEFGEKIPRLLILSPGSTI